MDILVENSKWEEVEYFSLAYMIAKDAHEGQYRDEGKPYITHIDGVLSILQDELNINSDMVLAVAALHDVLEDSDKYSFEDFKKAFGIHIATGALLLKHDKGQDVGEYLFAIDKTDDMPWLMLVKLADRLNNLRCLQYIKDKEKIKRKCKETRDYYLGYAFKYSDYIYNEMLKCLEYLESRV